jgi:phosphatidylglycerophosphatase A
VNGAPHSNSPTDTGSSLPRGLTFWNPAVLIATWFGAGLLPKAPGTWGSLAALPLAWAAVGLILFITGLWAVKTYIAHSDDKDPGVIVIDEVAAQILAVVPAGLDPIGFGLAFILFRIFDILKPWPIKALEKSLGSALGVMADDIAAALYTAILITIFMIILERPNVFF